MSILVLFTYLQQDWPCRAIDAKEGESFYLVHSRLDASILQPLLCLLWGEIAETNAADEAVFYCTLQALPGFLCHTIATFMTDCCELSLIFEI